MVWSPQLHSFCVHDTAFKECLEFEPRFEQHVVEKLVANLNELSCYLVAFFGHTDTTETT